MYRRTQWPTTIMMLHTKNKVCLILQISANLRLWQIPAVKSLKSYIKGASYIPDMRVVLPSNVTGVQPVWPCWVRPEWCCDWCPPVSAMLAETTMVLLLVTPVSAILGEATMVLLLVTPVSAMLGEARMVLLLVSNLYLPCWVRPEWCCYWCPTCICHVGWGQNGTVTGIPLYLPCWVRPQWCCYWWPLYLPCWVRPEWCCYWCPTCICHVGWGQNGAVTGVQPVSAMLGEARMVLLLVSNLYLPCWVRPEWYCYWYPPVSDIMGEVTMVLLLVPPCICHELELELELIYFT